MRGRMMMVLASVALAGILLATDAQADRGAEHGGDGGGGGGFRGNHFSCGFGGTAGDGYSSYGDRGSGLRGGYRGYGGRDVWGHWGAYYGPMVPTI
jgi:hypothetical protein